MNSNHLELPSSSFMFWNNLNRNHTRPCGRSLINCFINAVRPSVHLSNLFSPLVSLEIDQSVDLLTYLRWHSLIELTKIVVISIGDVSLVVGTPRPPVPASLHLVALQLKPSLSGLRAPEHRSIGGLSILHRNAKCTLQPCAVLPQFTELWVSQFRVFCLPTKGMGFEFVRIGSWNLIWTHNCWPAMWESLIDAKETLSMDISNPRHRACFM